MVLSIILKVALKKTLVRKSPKLWWFFLIIFFQKTQLPKVIRFQTNSFPFLEKLLKRARGHEQQPLLSKIRREGAFKPKDTFKTQDEKKPKYNLICIGSTRDAKNRIILSEKAQSEQSLATTVLNNAPMEAQKRIKQIAADKQKHKRMLTMSSKNFTFECQSQIKRKITIFDNSSCSDQDLSSMTTHQI